MMNGEGDCATCRYFHIVLNGVKREPDAGEADAGECHREFYDGALFYAGEDWLVVRGNFGCVQWEKTL